MLRRTLLATIVTLLACSLAAIFNPVSADGPTPVSKDRPRYTADGKLVRPADYREWIYLSSGLGMNYGPAANGGAQPPAFTNVFVNPEAYREFLRTARWPEGTVFALEIYGSATHSDPNKRGQFQDTFVALEAEVKDSSAPALKGETQKDVWRYYNFGASRPEAAPLPKESCFNCHEQSAAVEHSFVQFYPGLLDLAIERKVIKTGVRIPLNAARFREAIEQQGWKSAEAMYWNEKKLAGFVTPARDASSHEAGYAPGAADVAAMKGRPTAAGNGAASGIPEPAFALDEPALNGVGYTLLQSGRSTEAVSVFELVAREYPASANAYDSLADGYFAIGRKAEARAATLRSLELVKSEDVPAPQRDAITEAAKQRLADLAK